MKTAGCTLKLLAEKDDRFTPRILEVSIDEGRTFRSGTWRLMSESSDPRLKLGGQSGAWGLNPAEGEDGSGSWTLYLYRRSDYMIVLELYGLSPTFLEDLQCGSAFTGTAWHQGPPSSDLAYHIWYGCT